MNRLVRVAKMCKKLAVIKRKRLLLPWKNGGKEKERGSLVAQKGHFEVYTADERRYAIPIAYLNNKIFRKLLKMSEEEFGLQGDGPITFPCDAFFVEYLIMMIRQGAARNLETVLLLSIGSTPCHYSPLVNCFIEEQGNQHPLVCNLLVKQSCYAKRLISVIFTSQAFLDYS